MEKSGFFNSNEGDRMYAEEFFAEFFGSFIGNGVYPNPSTGCQVIATGDMTVAVSEGQAWINGRYYHNTDNRIFDLDIADGVLKRIDRIVLRHTTLDREIKAYVKKGSFASTPVAPALQRDADVWELGVADIFIGNGVISVTQANITDLRLSNDLCGIVHGVIDQVDTTTIFNQFQAWFGEFSGEAEAEFNTFLAQLEGLLSGDVAGNLLVKINENTADISQLQKFQTATGTATEITLTGVELVDGFQTTFVIESSNSGAATTINGKPLYKPGTEIAPKLIAGKAVTVWYNSTGDCFFIKASAEGTAVAEDVLAGKTFSNDDDTGLTGTLALTGDAIAEDVYSGKEFYKDDVKTKLTGTNHYKAGVKVPFTKIKPATPIQIASLDATSGTYNERMSIVFVTSDGYSFMVQYNGSANYVNVYNKDGIFLCSFSFSATAIYDFVIYNGYIYAFNDARVEKYSVNAGFTTITTVTNASIQNDSYRVKRIGDYVYYVKSSYMYNLNLNTLVYTQMIYKAGLSRFYAVDINNNLWGGNGYYTNVFKYDTAGNLILTLSLSTALYASPSYLSIDYSVTRGTMIFICFKEVSGVRKYFLLEYSVSGTLLNSVDLYTLYGIGGSASLYLDTYFGISNGLILFSCEKRLVALKESDLSLVTRLPAGSFDCTETRAILNGDYITGSMGNVHFCSSLVAELQ